MIRKKEKFTNSGIMHIQAHLTEFCLVFAVSLLFIISSCIQDNPFGIMPGHQVINSIDVRSTFGVENYRTAEGLFISGYNAWKGRCDECDKSREQGMKMILTVRYNNGSNNGIPYPSSPVPADQIEYYKQRAGQILDIYKPELVCIENEENSVAFYYDGTTLGVWDTPGDDIDTVLEYQKELNACCEVAHSRSIQCANGGITSGAAALMTWYHYIELEQPDNACDFAKRGLYYVTSDHTGEEFCAIRSVSQVPQEYKEEIDKLKRLLGVYTAATNDYTNFHWYSRDAEALKETAAYLEETTKKPVIINEIGQKNWDTEPQYIEPRLQAVLDVGMPYLVWFSIDTGGASALTDATGTLRPSGVEFQTFIKEHFP